jgi:hypothetical protein
MLDFNFSGARALRFLSARGTPRNALRILDSGARARTAYT